MINMKTSLIIILLCLICAKSVDLSNNQNSMLMTQFLMNPESGINIIYLFFFNFCPVVSDSEKLMAIAKFISKSFNTIDILPLEQNGLISKNSSNEVIVTKKNTLYGKKL